MAFRLVGSAGEVNEPVMVSVPGSGVINPNTAVDFIRGTSGNVVGPSGTASTTTMIFGVAQTYAQGASDVSVNVIPFDPSQLWEADCANSGSTAQIGLRHILSVTRGFLHNTATDVVGQTGVFLALGLTSATTGSGKLIGRFISNITPVGQNSTTFI